MPLVSVIMPVYNGEQFLAEAIESILAQTFTDFELIIVDDGSQGASARIIRSYEEADSRITFLQHDHNLGQAQAQNTGIAAADGEYIALMDCDDVSLPARLEQQVRFLQANPEIGVVGVYSKLVNQDMTAEISTRIVPLQHAPIVLNLFYGAPSLLTASCMFRLQPLQSVGGFAPNLYYKAETDLVVRLLFQTRIRIANLPEVLYLYRQHGSNKSTDKEPSSGSKKNLYARRSLNMLWDEVTDDTVMRFQRFRYGEKLSWPDRRAAKKDLRRLIESLIDHSLVKPTDRPLLLAAMDRCLEQASPRLWQQFCHWRRHHFGRPASQTNSA